MARNGRTVLNHAGIAAMLKSPDMEAVVAEEAAAVLARAQAGAPVRTGAYRDSLHVAIDRHPGRVVAHIGSDAPHAATVEAATGNLVRALGGSS